MRRLVLMFAILGLLLGLGGALAPAPAAAQGNVSEFCTANNDFGVSHGGCVAFFTTDNPTAAAADMCRDQAFREAIATFFGLSETPNHGHCVQLAKTLL